jgi:hypothetical protein
MPSIESILPETIRPSHNLSTGRFILQYDLNLKNRNAGSRRYRIKPVKATKDSIQICKSSGGVTE